ncbi:DegT/DnrJ/EryC1/StrS aminotransferase family protein [Polynucleobacter sp. JS-Mosq-20-D10]|uniref:DegT/DnrJ/EryC1/StrS family aminotransferase n=1 Tax=Polynucleobacter sp. JS-Mosq-20-D10 TaxID=2576922 RepID=UPI00203B03C6|nr:DegT/DnrJ/EryC1/StrS family aminotransferase [Polynucleobacter sp. JS-Mosq-20-D10]
MSGLAKASDLHLLSYNIKMSIPFIDLTRFEDHFLLRWSEKVAELSKKASFIGGYEVEIFEQRLSDLTQVDNVVTCANGTDAIQLALRALGVGVGDYVLVPNVTFWATYEAAVNVGAIPITIDVDLIDGGVDLSAFILAAEKYQPKAAVIAHLYGWATRNLDFIRTFCKDSNIFLVEDGAQCFGVQLNGQSIYKDALLSTTSFYPAKVLGGAGDGGAVFSNKKSIAEEVRRLGNHGRTSHYGYGSIGWNSRLDSIQAAYLNIALDYLPQRISSRRNAAKYYQNSLSTIGVKQILAPEFYEENGYCNVTIFEDFDLKRRVEKGLRDKNIGFGNIYPAAISDQPAIKSILHMGGRNSQKLCESILNLPLYPYMTEIELKTVVDTVASLV